jgi:transcription antitermination protein NusB
MAKAYTGRRAARVLTIQGLYAWLLSGIHQTNIEQDLLDGTYNQILTNFEPNHDSLPCKNVDEDYFRACLHACIQNYDQLNGLIEPKLDRELSKLGSVEHAILLLGAYELSFRQDVPYKVVINEAIDLAKDFGAQESHKFINGVLDRIKTPSASNLRTA